jgi:tRNA(Ile)-lysidine synthase
LELLQGMMDQVWPGLLVDVGDQALALDLQAWRDLPLGLRRRALLKAAFQLRPNLRDFSFDRVEAARRVAETATTGARVALPGRLCLTVSYGRLWICAQDHAPAPPEDWPTVAPNTVVVLQVPGRTPLRGDWFLEATWLAADDAIKAAIRQNENPWRAFLDAERAGADLVLRTRASGDRFRPLGLGGRTALLSDFMINVRIPSMWRDQVPILARAEGEAQAPGEILWIAGWRLDERVSVQPGSRRILRLDFQRP